MYYKFKYLIFLKIIYYFRIKSFSKTFIKLTQFKSQNQIWKPKQKGAPFVWNSFPTLAANTVPQTASKTSLTTLINYPLKL